MKEGQTVTSKCIDNSPHNFVMQGDPKLERVGYSEYKETTRYYCTKCLKIETLEKSIYIQRT